jgi:hypothetical protein
MAGYTGTTRERKGDAIRGARCNGGVMYPHRMFS